MTRESRRPADHGRRRFLALTAGAGLASLAGCADRLPGTGPTTVDGDAVADLASADAPTVPQTLPLDIEASFVAAARAAAQSKLDDVPAPFDREQIPNGVIRERLNGEYESARESIRGVSDAPTPYERLGRANRARTSAHEVLTAWRAIESTVSLADLQDSRAAVGDDVETFVDRWSYVGEDPVRAAVVHAEIEREIRGARNWLSVREVELDAAEGQPLELGQIGADVEHARIDVGVASYLFDRLRDRVGGADAPNRRSQLDAASEELRDRVREARDDLPPEDVEDPASLVDRDVERTAGVRALDQLVSEARRRVRRVLDDRDSGGEPMLATTSLAAAPALSYHRAFERLRDRIEGGDDVAVESLDDVEAHREAAVTAVESAREAEDGRTIVDAILPAFAREIEWVDDRFQRRSGSVDLEVVSREASGYVVAAETCRAVPTVSAAVEAVLRDS